jgi:S-DNA-T family DNA segregation ATPase FtsK/SpoIIIE
VTYGTNEKQNDKQKPDVVRRRTGGKNRREAGFAAQRNSGPHRREVAAVVVLLLGIFSIISYFSAEGVFINFFSALMKGLLGYGYYAIPPLLILCAVILGFHRGRPVRFRVACALLLSVSLSALLHLLISKAPYRIEIAMLKKLWDSGKALRGGGALGGALSEIFTYLFSKTGAAILFICTGLFCLLAALNKTVAGIVDAFRHRERYEPEPVSRQPSAPVRENAPVRGEELSDTAPGAGVRQETRRRAGRMIDIPLDEPPAAAESALPAGKRDGFFDAKPRVKTPDEILKGDAPAAAEKKPDTAPNVAPAADIPLDNPFMEKQMSGRKQDVPAAEAAAAPPKPETPAKSDPPAKTDAEQGKSAYVFPPLDLLSAPVASGRVDGAEEVRLNIERLEAAFRSFGVNVKISSYTRGPAVTRYEAELEAGIKLNRLTSLADDIALSLGASGVRIAAMPNKIPPSASRSPTSWSARFI